MTEKTLRQSVLSRLDQLDQAAAHGETEVLLPVARNEIYRLAQGFRTLLDDHQPDEDGRCRACRGSLRSRRWPCSVWTIAHRHLITECTNSTFSRRQDDSSAHRSQPHVNVLPTAIIASGSAGPGDWDTEEFTLPELPPAAKPTWTATPPVREPLETDYRRIHRAAVIDRPVRWPRPSTEKLS